MNDTLQFILVCLGVVAGLLLIAWLYEHFVCRQRLRLTSAKYISTVGMCAALAGILMLLEVPLLFLAPEFYKIDLSELPVMICAFYLGPVAGVLTEFLKVLVKLLLKGSTTAYVGDFANFVVGCALILPAAMIYHAKKSKTSALLGLCTGTVVMTLFGSIFNAVYLLPAFASLFHMPMDTILSMGQQINGSIYSVTTFVAFAVAPLNLIKGALVSILTMLLYKRVERVLFRRK